MPHHRTKMCAHDDDDDGITYITIFVARDDEESLDVVVPEVAVPFAPVTRLNSVVAPQVSERLFRDVDSSEKPHERTFLMFILILTRLFTVYMRIIFLRLGHHHAQNNITKRVETHETREIVTRTAREMHQSCVRTRE